MSKTLAVGTQFAVAASYGTAKTFSSITNAAEAVASFAADPSLAAGDIIEVTSGWTRLDKRVVRVKTVTGSGPYLVTLESLDSSNTSLYPAGSGAGTVREILTWTTISQVQAPSIGEPSIEYADGNDLDIPINVRIPARITPPDGKLTVHYDPAASWIATVRTISESLSVAALRMTTPAGSKIYGNCYWILSEFPQAGGAVETLKATVAFNFAALPLGYAT